MTLLGVEAMNRVRDNLLAIQQEHSDPREVLAEVFSLDPDALREMAEDATYMPAFEDPHAEQIAIFLTAVQFGMLLEREVRST